MKEKYKSLIYIYYDSRGKLYATIISTGYSNRDAHSGTSNQNKEYRESS